MSSRRWVGGLAALAVTMSGSAIAMAGPANAGSVTSPAFSKNPDAIVTQQGTDGRTNLLEPKGAPVQRPKDIAPESKPEEVAKAHLDTYAKAFGVKSDDMAVTRSTELGSGDVVRFNQNIDEVPVLGAELVTSLDVKGNLEFILGDTVSGPDGSFPIAPESKQRELAQVAVDAVVRAEATDEGVELTAENQGAVWYDPSVFGAPSFTDAEGVRPVYQFEVTDGNGSVRWEVLVNASTSEVEMAYSKIAHALNRAVCDGENEPRGSTPEEIVCMGPNDLEVARGEGDDPSGINDVDAMYDQMYETAVTFANYANVDLTELLGAETTGGEKVMLGLSRYCEQGEECPYPNAFWNGYQISFGDGMVVPDVTAHELSHGVTENTSDLAYMYQSGAINEALSDIWGKLMHLTQYDVPDGERWDVGTGSAIGVIRNMQDPTQYEQPDKMSSEFWLDDEGTFFDNGGVHFNSGVGNKAAYLMIDGDSFNGYDVNGIGYAKTAKIFWSVTNMLTSGADYKDLFHTLPLACRKNIDAPGTFITEADCQEVDKVVRATEMYQDPAQGSPANVQYCEGHDDHTAVYYEGFEDSGSWDFGDSWALASEVNWYNYVNTGEDAASAFGPNGPGGELTQPEGVELPEGAQVRFDHAYILAGNEDLAVEYSTDGGSTWQAASGLPNTHGDSSQWTDTSRGWAGAKYDLSSLAGETVQFRFNTQLTPESTWYVDNFKIYTCN